MTVASFSEEQLAEGSQVIMERHGAHAIPMLGQAGGLFEAPVSIKVYPLDGT